MRAADPTCLLVVLPLGEQRRRGGEGLVGALEAGFSVEGSGSFAAVICADVP